MIQNILSNLSCQINPFMIFHINRKLGNQSKPLVTITAVDDKTISFKQESLVKTSEFSCQIGVPFDEVTADGRKVSKLIQNANKHSDRIILDSILILYNFNLAIFVL